MLATAADVVLPHWGKLQQYCRWYRGSQCPKAQSQGNKSHRAPVSMEVLDSHSKIHHLKRRAKKKKKRWTLAVNLILCCAAWYQVTTRRTRRNRGAKKDIITIGWAAKETYFSKKHRCETWAQGRSHSFTSLQSHFKAGWESIFIGVNPT